MQRDGRRSSVKRWGRYGRMSVAATLLSGCATTAPPADPTLSAAAEIAKATVGRGQELPNPLPTALECMDKLLYEKGVFDITLLQEEFRGGPQVAKLATRGMFSSAISKMTGRSRAIHLSAVGADQTDLAQLLLEAKRASAFGAVPKYLVRASISQVDESVLVGDVGILERIRNIFKSREKRTNFEAWTVDAAVVYTQGLVLVPGVSSRSTAVIARQADGPPIGGARIGTSNFEFKIPHLVGAEDLLLLRRWRGHLAMLYRGRARV